MLLVKFLNKLFKKDGFLLIDANGKEHIIGKPKSISKAMNELLNKDLEYSSYSDDHVEDEK